MKNNNFCPDDCKYLSINEKDQNKFAIKPPHICLLFKRKLFHGQYHPKLLRCTECVEDK